MEANVKFGLHPCDWDFIRLQTDYILNRKNRVSAICFLDYYGGLLEEVDIPIYKRGMFAKQFDRLQQFLKHSEV